MSSPTTIVVKQKNRLGSVDSQQLTEAARRRYTGSLAAELEKRQQKEVLVTRRAELPYSQQERTRLAAAERQHALSMFPQDLRGPQPVFF